MFKLNDRANHAVFAIVTLLFWASPYVYVPILSPYLEELGASYTIAGIVLGSYGLMQIILRLPFGITSDKLRRRKPFVLLGMLCATLSCVSLASSETVGWALAGRILSGISASTWVAFTVMYAGYYRSNEATRAMGNISLLIASGQLAGMILSGLLVEWGGWLAPFATGGLFGFVGLLLAFLLKEPEERLGGQPMRVGDLLPVMKERLLLKVSTLSILAHGILFITMFGFTPSYALSLGASKAELTWLSAAFMVPHALFAYLSGRYLAPRFGAWNVVLTGLAMSALCSALTPLVADFRLLLATQALNGLFQGLHFPLLLGLAIERIDGDRRATAMGFYQAVYAIGMFAGPFVAGFLNETGGLRSGFYFAGLLGAAAAALALRWKRAAAEASAARIRGNERSKTVT